MPSFKPSATWRGPIASHRRRSTSTAIASRALELRHYEHKRGSINTVLERGDGGPKRVRMDAQQLLQAILNLIVNAEQAVAGSRTGAIRVSVAADDRHVAVSVADNGPGIAQDLDLIAPFVTTRGSAAAGLGLAAARLIARQAGVTWRSSAARTARAGRCACLSQAPRNEVV